MDALTSIAEIVRTLITKISTLFDVIDLSFFVSGGTCMLAFVYMRYVLIGALPDLSGGLAFAIAILGSYVMGLLCFAIGRWFRRKVIGRPWAVELSKHMTTSLGSHGLEQHQMMSAYLATGSVRKDALYPRLWAELRQDGTLKPSFELISSYWVRAAVYDGLIAALFIWSLAIWRTLGASRGFETQPEIGYGALAFVGIGILACAREAGRSERFQVDEITATMAYVNDRRLRELELLSLERARQQEEEDDAHATPALKSSANPSLIREPAAAAPSITKAIDQAPDKKGKRRPT